MTIAFHFTADALLRDGRPLPAIGTPLVFEGTVRICRSGLHASELLIDALTYAPFPNCTLELHVVRCGGIVERERDKFVCCERTILHTSNVTYARLNALLIEFAEIFGHHRLNAHLSCKSTTLAVIKDCLNYFATGPRCPGLGKRVERMAREKLGVAEFLRTLEDEEGTLR